VNGRTISRKQRVTIDDFDFQIATNVNKIPEIFSMTIRACCSAETSFQQLSPNCQRIPLSAMQTHGSISVAREDIYGIICDKNK
jgi:hypothetical protein